MPYWKVRAGATIASDGKMQPPGTVLELPRRLAQEFPHALDECNARGQILDAAPPAWAQALEGIPDHENVDILRGQRDSLVAQVNDLREIVERTAETATAAARELAAAQASLASLDQRITEEIAAAKALHDRRLQEEARGTKRKAAESDAATPQPAA